MNRKDVAELLNRRRRQILVHSIIYYKMDDNLISDSAWSAWATELEELQKKYPEITAAFPTKIVLYYGSIFLTGPAGGIIVSPRPIQPVQFGVPPFFL